MSIRHSWTQRIERAEQVARHATESREYRDFYVSLLHWQRATFELLAGDSRSISPAVTGSIESDQSCVCDRIPSLLAVVSRGGSESLRAKTLSFGTDKSRWLEALAAYWNGTLPADGAFFPRTCLQPYLVLLAELGLPPRDSELFNPRIPTIEGSEAAELPRTCPFCGRLPQLAILSAEPSIPGTLEGAQEGGTRRLQCGDCLTTWPFQRVACPACFETEPSRLPYYVAAELPHVRVDCCDTCRRYVKTIDLTKDARPVPCVDELLSIELDLWAREQGYTKILPNLAGL